MNRKRAELPGFEKIQELYFQSQLFSLREYYRNLSGEEEFKATLSSVTRKHAYPSLFDIDHFVLKDASLQASITRDITDFVSFIESTFYINIGTVRAKFVLSKHSAQPIFSGATDCFFQFKTPDLQAKFGWSNEVQTDRLIERFTDPNFKQQMNPVKVMSSVAKPHSDGWKSSRHIEEVQHEAARHHAEGQVPG